MKEFIIKGIDFSNEDFVTFDVNDAEIQTMLNDITRQLGLDESPMWDFDANDQISDSDSSFMRIGDYYSHYRELLEHRWGDPENLMDGCTVALRKDDTTLSEHHYELATAHPFNLASEKLLAHACFVPLPTWVLSTFYDNSVTDRKYRDYLLEKKATKNKTNLMVVDLMRLTTPTLTAIAREVIMILHFFIDKFNPNYPGNKTCSMTCFADRYLIELVSGIARDVFEDIDGRPTDSVFSYYAEREYWTYQHWDRSTNPPTKVDNTQMYNFVALCEDKIAITSSDFAKYSHISLPRVQRELTAHEYYSGKKYTCKTGKVIIVIALSLIQAFSTNRMQRLLPRKVRESVNELIRKLDVATTSAKLIRGE